ncbi:MAG: hypothetical protein ACRD0A_04725 [Acidimicrobiales bacterium]
MVKYVQLGDVHTFYEEDGQGEPLVLLHPGGADSRVFESHGAVSPDGPNAFPVLNAKLDRMHEQEPTLTVADLAGYPGPRIADVTIGPSSRLPARSSCPRDW